MSRLVRLFFIFLDRREIDEMDKQTNPFDKRLEQARAKEQKRTATWQEIEYEQPEKCIGCYWGEWLGAVQFCSKPDDMCVKENAS